LVDAGLLHHMEKEAKSLPKLVKNQILSIIDIWRKKEAIEMKGEKKMSKWRRQFLPLIIASCIILIIIQVSLYLLA